MIGIAIKSLVCKCRKSLNYAEANTCLKKKVSNREWTVGHLLRTFKMLLKQGYVEKYVFR